MWSTRLYLRKGARTYTVYVFMLHEVPKVVKSMEPEGRAVVARDRSRGNGELLLNRYRVSA